MALISAPLCNPQLGFGDEPGNRIERSQALFKLFAYHFVTIQEYAHGFWDKAIPSGHGPGDSREIAFGLERELGAIRALEGLQKIEPEAH
jgi:hypothetical protein